MLTCCKFEAGEQPGQNTKYEVGPNYLSGMQGPYTLKVNTEILVAATMDWTVRGSNPFTNEIFLTRTDRYWDPHFFLYNGHRVSSPEVKQLRVGVNHPPPT